MDWWIGRAVCLMRRRCCTRSSRHLPLASPDICEPQALQGCHISGISLGVVIRHVTFLESPLTIAMEQFLSSILLYSTLYYYPQSCQIYHSSSILQHQVRQTSPGHATQQALGAAIPKQMSSPANERCTCCLGSIFPRLDAVSVPLVRRHLPTRATIVLRLSYRPYVPDDSYIIILPADTSLFFLSPRPCR